MQSSSYSYSKNITTLLEDLKVSLINDFTRAAMYPFLFKMVGYLTVVWRPCIKDYLVAKLLQRW